MDAPAGDHRLESGRSLHLEKNVLFDIREAKFMFLILLIATIALWAYNLKRGWVL